jgi:hypothetical protein
VNVIGAATMVAALMTALTGLLGWRLSQRAQAMASRRQEAIDQGPFIEQQRLWQAEIVAWYKDRVREMERECEEEIREIRIRYGQAVQEAERRADHWKARAEAYRLGRDPSDDTPPPEPWDRRTQSG